MAGLTHNAEPLITGVRKGKEGMEHELHTGPPRITDVMQALTSRPEGQRQDPMKLDRIRSSLGLRLEDRPLVRDAVRGAEEHGLVVSWHNAVTLTPEGQLWSESEELPEIRYVYQAEGELAVGTLKDWATLPGESSEEQRG